MAKIIIQDLEQNKALDRAAMTAIHGGFNPQPEPPRNLVSLSNVRRARRASFLNTLRSAAGQTAGISFKL